MSDIQWTDQTWNPTVGCSRVSAGCDHCYAIKVAQREMQPAHKGLTIGGDWTGEVRCLPERLEQPFRWRKPRRVFVDSMSDLFHKDVPLDFLAQVWDVMVRTPQHTYQILTKRPERVARALGPDGLGFYAVEGNVACPQPNIWIGASIEDERYARIRGPHVGNFPSVVPFFSVEPLIGEVTLTPYLRRINDEAYAKSEYEWKSRVFPPIGWVIVGGESGPGARPMRQEWAEKVVAECRQWGVPVFVKQLGSVWAREHGATDRKGGDPDEWPEHLRVREYPVAAA